MMESSKSLSRDLTIPIKAFDKVVRLKSSTEAEVGAISAFLQTRTAVWDVE